MMNHPHLTMPMGNPMMMQGMGSIPCSIVSQYCSGMPGMPGMPGTGGFGGFGGIPGMISSHDVAYQGARLSPY
jgi:hypothetical protein